jgi:hypothetical protein
MNFSGVNTIIKIIIIVVATIPKIGDTFSSTASNNIDDNITNAITNNIIPSDFLYLLI